MIQADSGIALRTEGAKDIRRFGLLLAHHPGPRSLAHPQARLRAALADAHFILKPHIYLLRRNAKRQRNQYLCRKVFLNSACATGSAHGLTARAEIHTMPKRLIRSYTPFKL
jgi:hypothetical protein